MFSQSQTCKHIHTCTCTHNYEYVGYPNYKAVYLLSGKPYEYKCGKTGFDQTKELCFDVTSDLIKALSVLVNVTGFNGKAKLEAMQCDGIITTNHHGITFTSRIPTVVYSNYIAISYLCLHYDISNIATVPHVIIMSCKIV